MKLEQVLKYAKTLIKSCTHEGDLTIDATVGNGNDTLFLANLVGPSGTVFGFDIQEAAINNTKKLLSENNIHHVELFLSGHEYAKNLIPIEDHQRISSAIFNLGYLPSGDKKITTKGKTTLDAIRQILEMLKINGLIVIVVYYGHGKEEMNELLTHLSLLDQKIYQVLQYRFLNQKNDAPFIIAIEKIK